MSYTVMGDGVNIASRLEGINKEFGTRICISHSVFKEAGERLCVRPIDDVTVKGRRGKSRSTSCWARSAPTIRSSSPIPRRCELCQADPSGLRGADQGGLRTGAASLSRDTWPSFRTIRWPRCWSGGLSRCDGERRVWGAAWGYGVSKTKPVPGLPSGIALAALRPSEYTAALIQVLQADAGCVRGATVLEIGSGSGVVLAALGGLGAASLCGIDIEEDAVASGMLLLEELGHDKAAELHHGDMWSPGRRAPLRPDRRQPAALPDGRQCQSPAACRPGAPAAPTGGGCSIRSSKGCAGIWRAGGRAVHHAQWLRRPGPLARRSSRGWALRCASF